MTETLSEPIKQQLVLDQLAKDPLGNHGPRLVKEGIAFDTGIHLTRCVIDLSLIRSLVTCGIQSICHRYDARHES